MAQSERLRLALLTTVWGWRNHANHMGERFLSGYPVDGRWHRPAIDVVSVYVEQVGEGDLSRQRAGEHGFEIYPTIAEALRRGGDELAVDAVLLIGEHGDYPSNEKGQKLYPRYEYFEQIVGVFKEDGRAVPVFNDKHLSYSFAKAKRMVGWADELGFALLAGSSLPVTFRLPPVEIPLDSPLEEALMVGVGGSDAMDYHALEALQCMVERRRGGESGVRAVQLLDGEAAWRAGEEGRWSRRLLEAALARSDSRSGLGAEDGRPQNWTGDGEMERLVEKPAAYLIEYNDGFRATLLMLSGAVQDYTFAARLGGGELVSTQFLLPPSPNVVYSACLMAKAEEMFVSGRAPYPAERTLLVSGALERCLDSRLQGNIRLETPELAVSYRAPQASQFGAAPV